MEIKEIIIVDAYIKHQSLENLFCEQLEWFKSINIPVLVNSNSILSERVLNMVDYFFYDKNNLLFKESDFDQIDKGFYNFMDGNISVKLENVNFQRHALSVIVNLLNSLNLAKSLGFTHFHRFEYDSIGGPIMADIVKNMNSFCKYKKGFVYMSNPYRVDDTSFKNGINPYYFYFEIDYFLKNVFKVFDKSSYFEYLKKINMSRTYLSYERFIAENISRNDLSFRSNLIINYNKTPQDYFQDYFMNRSHSALNYSTDKVYERGYTVCFCKLVGSSPTNPSQIVIYQDNLSDKVVNFKLVVYDIDESVRVVYDRNIPPYIKMWDVTENVSKVEIYDLYTNLLIDTIHNIDIKNEFFT
jgi:hypothetical protein